MMLSRAAGVVASLCLAVAADKPTGPKQGGNNAVEVIATAHVEKPEVTKILGMDPGVNLIVVEVRVEPKDRKLAVWRDDFTLLSNKDGQKSQPLAPAQIAGRGALVVSQSGGGGGGFGLGNANRGPIWGGAPGTMGRPRRIGGDDNVVGSSGTEETKATVDSGEKQPENPLLAVLKEKVLVEKESSEPVSGLLYFLFEGKHKLKDLDLIYKSPDGRVILDFQR
jgi:hypothetical protein